LAEAYAFPGEKRPADPSGRIGYFVVALLDPEGHPRYFDPFGGHEAPPAGGDVTVLTDVQAIAAALALDALYRSTSRDGASQAVDYARAGVTLSPRSPTVRASHGMVLLSGGGVEEGTRELEAALQIRPDGPRRVQAAALYLAKGELDRAAREVSRALEQYPDDASAHASLASVYLMRHEQGLAQRALETAERLDPDLSMLPMLWAGYHLATGSLEQARARAEDAVERRPYDLQARLMLARVYRQLNRYEDMRRQARAVLDQAPVARREEMKQTLKSMLGPTALDAPLDLDAPADPDAPRDQQARGSGDGLDLPELPSPTLQLDKKRQEPLLNLGDPSTLQLKDEGTRLELELDR
jgi:tetratricopeptide (TPR) repeat protein